MSVTIISNDGDDLIEITLSATGFYANKQAFWGWMNTSEMLTEAQIVVLQGTGTFPAAGMITADFRPANAAPMFLYLAELETEPIKTSWEASPTDQGLIGPGQVFTVIGVVGAWRVYRTFEKTTFSTTTKFKV